MNHSWLRFIARVWTSHSSSVQDSTSGAMMLFPVSLILFLTAFSSLPGISRAQVPDAGEELRINGSNTVYWEYHNNTGSPDVSPWAEEGAHWYDELNLDAEYQFSRYERLRLQLSALYNRSDYRGQFQDLTAENWNILYEKGDWALPLRLEAGDFLANVSQLTQFRTLKGVQFDLQPEWAFLDGRQSLLFFGGVDYPTWRHIGEKTDYSTGASWLIEAPLLGAVSLNHVFNTYEESTNADDAREDQHVSSVAWERQFKLGTEEFFLEAEIAHFDGTPRTEATEMDRRKSDTGIFTSVSWESVTPLSLRLQFEQYGEYYQPEGASVSADRRAYESHLAWRFPSGLPLRLRYQHYDDGYEGDNMTETDTIGFSLAGPFGNSLIPNLSGNLSGYWSNVENEDRTSQSDILNLSTSLSLPMSGGWVLSPNCSVTSVDDRTPDGELQNTLQAGLSAVHALEMAGWNGSGSLGVSARRLTGTTDDNELVPTAALNLAKGGHRLNVDASYQTLQYQEFAANDTEGYSLGAAYSYSLNSHEFGVETRYEAQWSNPGADGAGFMASCYWRYDFGYTQKRTSKLPPFSAAGGIPATGVPDLSLLTQLWPGMPLDEAARVLANYQVHGARELPDANVYELRLIRNVQQRQRLVLVHDGSRKLKSVVLIINPDDVGEGDTMRRLYARIYREAIRSFGRPVRFREEGNFGPALFAEVNAGRFVRIAEWNTGAGLLRIGIPRRLDGMVRIEFQHARSLPGLSNTLWSIEPVK